MIDKRIDVILNLANSMGAAFIAISGTLLAIWRAGHLLELLGVVIYTGFFIIGLFTATLYIWAFKLTSR